MNRKTVLIISGVTLTIIGILLWYYGFFNRFNYCTAKSDIRNNTPYKVIVGELIISPVEMNKISVKYGFKNVGVGCIVDAPKQNGIKMYNTEIERYLNKINEKGWQSKYQKEIDSLIKANENWTEKYK